MSEPWFADPATVAETEQMLRGVARRYWPHDGDDTRRDLVQAAWVRLLRSARFDGRVPFRAWVAQRARWAMSEALRQRSGIGGTRTRRAQVFVLDADVIEKLESGTYTLYQGGSNHG